MADQNVHENILSCIGQTPLVRLNRVTDGIRTQVWAKCEFMNPGSSVKDRIGMAIVEDAERQGTIRPGGTLVEATSGNTGVGLALAATIKGYRCVFTIPDKMSMEKVKLLKAFGAEVIVTPHRRARAPGELRQRREADREADAQLLPRQPVLQPGQPQRALRVDGSGALGADGRQDRRDRRRPGERAARSAASAST